MILLLPVIYGLALLFRPFSPDWKTALYRSGLVIGSFWGGAFMGVVWGPLPTLALSLILRAAGVEGRNLLIPMLCVWLGGGPVVGTIIVFRWNLENERRERESLEGKGRAGLRGAGDVVGQEVEGQVAPSPLVSGGRCMVKDALASLAKSIGGLILLPVLLCLSFVPLYLFGAFLLWMGVWNEPASESACKIYGWIPHLADCPDRARSVVLTGQILLDGQPIPRAQEGSGMENIAFLSAFIGPRRVGLDEFYSNPRYVITIAGTTAMEGEEITFQLQLSPSCNPTKCLAPETIPFKSGMREVDLHFESNR